MAERKPVLKNKQNTLAPRFGFTPKTGIAFPKMGVYFFLCPLHAEGRDGMLPPNTRKLLVNKVIGASNIIEKKIKIRSRPKTTFFILFTIILRQMPFGLNEDKDLQKAQEFVRSRHGGARGRRAIALGWF